MKLRVIIVDDEQIARQSLRRLLNKESDIEVVAECVDGKSAIQAVRKHLPDLLFLDVKMPGLDGFDVVEALDGGNQPAVVFVTAFDRHAVHAFETCALDYLLKPLSSGRLAKTLARVRRHLKGSTSLVPVEATTSELRRFIVRSGQRTSFVAQEEIDWVEADGNYAILHVARQNHLLRETMSALERRLPADSFIRVSRSAIVRLDRVKEIHTTPGGHHTAILTTGQRVPLTRGVRSVQTRLANR